MTNDRNDRVASVASQSSNYEIQLKLTPDARNIPLVGSVVYLVNPMGEGGEELALGSITQVTTTNKLLEVSQMQPALAANGEVRGWSGDDGDMRHATIRVQAAWRRSSPTGNWRPSGPSLRMSPATGTAVKIVTDDIVDDITCPTEKANDIHYLGKLMGSDDTRLPMSLPDFAGRRGAWHGGLFGMTGSGKTAMSCYLIAGQLRHPSHGIIVVDPQGQWSNEGEFVFGVQAFAKELGRPVRVHRISDDLRLRPNPELFVELLKQTAFTKELYMKDPSTTEAFWHEGLKFLRNYEGQKDERGNTLGWEDTNQHRLLTDYLEHMGSERVAGRIYLSDSNAEKFRERVQGLLESPADLDAAGNCFYPILNLFQPVNGVGEKRHEIGATFKEIFDRREGDTAPVVILDMSTQRAPSMEETNAFSKQFDAILGRDDIKATILRAIFADMKRESERAFGSGRNLNTMVVLDEAWRYAAPIGANSNENITELSRELAGYARDTRKFGIGWFFISQSPRSVNPDIWGQMSIRIFGSGLSGNDAERIVEVLDSRDSIQMYRLFPPPSATGEYPFMLVGPGSPLAVNNTPVNFFAYNDFDRFRQDNDLWIRPLRAKLGEPVLTGTPETVTRGAKRAGVIPQGKDRARIIDTNHTIKENKKSTGLRDVDGFADPLAVLDGDAPF